MNIIITGATSGIGKELAVQLSAKGHKVGLTGRRTKKLRELKEQIGGFAFYETLDVTQLKKAETIYHKLIEQMGGLDMMILNAGVGRIKKLTTWETDKNIINVNVMAFAHGCHFAFEHFRKQGHGHIVGMSSVASHLAFGSAAAYTASKHFISNYMTGYRQKAKRVDADITITDIRPGYVWTEMTELNKTMFWVAPVDKAVRQMVKAIEKKRNRVYVTKRWRLAAWFAELIPEWIWDRI